LIEGHYKLYLDGELVVASSNLITNFGKSTILRYMAGNISSYAGAVAVGVSSTAASSSDYVLDYELFRVPIAYRTANPTNSSVVFKGTAGAGLSGKVYEIGLFPSQNNDLSGAYQTATIHAFDNDLSLINISEPTRPCH
jgi:hypothetical protein